MPDRRHSARAGGASLSELAQQALGQWWSEACPITPDIEETMNQSLRAYYIETEPFYWPSAGEVELFEAAYAQRMPIILKGRLAAARRASWNTWHGA
jgi:hypothetical protein